MTGVIQAAAKGPSARALRHAIMLTTALTAPAFAAAAQADDAGAPMLMAQAGQHSFNIPAQPLPSALALFGQQAGLQISAHGDAVRGLSTKGVSGTLSTDAALQQLLAGTGLSYRISGDGTVTIENPETGETESGAIKLSPILVEDRRGLDDHAGAADRARSITITQQDLERRNPTTVKDVFAGESSVSVGGGIPLSQKVYVNGIEETNLAVSIDGARQNNKVFHHNGTNFIDPALLKAARVDPGVAPADAGPAALGGAIVYETVDVDDVLEPGRDFGGFSSLSYETNGETFIADFAGFGRAEGFEVLGYVKRADGENYDDGDGNEVVGSGADLLSLLGKAAFESESGHRFELSAEQVNDNANRPFRANIGRLTNRPAQVVREYDLTRRNFTFNYSIPTATGMFDPKIVLSYAETEVDVPVPFGSQGQTSSFSGKIENDFNLNENDIITAGIDFYDDTAEYKDPGTDTQESATNGGIYAQARLQPLDPLRLSFGVRGDYQEFEGTDGSTHDNSGLSGNASAEYDVTDFLTLNAGYSNVWGGIALAENYILNPAWDYSGGIEPVRAENLTAGFKTLYEGFSFGANIFRSDFENARDENFGAGPAITVDFETEGFDVSAGYTWGPGFVRATYTDTEIEVDGQATNSDATQYLGAPLGRIIAVEASHRFDPLGLTIGGTIDAALENTDLSNNAKQEAYESVDLYTEYQPQAADYLTFRLEANNIFDETYADRATYGQEFANVVPLYEKGRSFLIMTKLRF